MIRRVRRFDSIELRTDGPVTAASARLRPARVMPGGRLRLDGVLTRTGVFTYRNADGTERREYRPDAEVFAPAALASFGGVAVTDDHPSELLTIHDTTGRAVGAVVGDPRRDGGLVIGEITLWDAAAISKLRVGKTALSCGYDVDLEMTPGTSPAGERYDCIQRNVRGNHLAVVDVARAGSVARLRVDDDDLDDDADNGVCNCNLGFHMRHEHALVQAQRRRNADLWKDQ